MEKVDDDAHPSVRDTNDAERGEGRRASGGAVDHPSSPPPPPPSNANANANATGPPPGGSANRSTTTTMTSVAPPNPPPPPAADALPSRIDDDVDVDDLPDANDALLAMSFNQDGGCLAVGTGSGFRICNVHPYQETFRRKLGGIDAAITSSSAASGMVSGGGTGGGIGRAGIAQIEMLYRTNLLALTGHATSPHYPPNKVYLYDDHLQRPIGELSFRQRVLTTRLRRDRIVVVLRDRVYVYNFSDLTLLDKVHTGDNPHGLVGISTDNGGVGGITTSRAGRDGGRGIDDDNRGGDNGMVLACPGVQRGQVRVELYGLRRTTFVDAHESALGALALSVDGCLLATASERGTVVRLFDTRGVTIGGGGGGLSSSSGREASAASSSAFSSSGGSSATVSSSIPLREFRRGVDRAIISCLVFSLDSAWLGCASDHGTVHVFRTDAVGNGNGDAANSDPRPPPTRSSMSSSMTGKAMRMLPRLLVTSPRTYLVDGVQSYAQVRGVPHPRACAFVPDRERTISVAGLDEYGNGCLLIAEFGDRVGGAEGGVGGVGINRGNATDDTEARRVGYHRFFKCKSPASQTGRRHRSKNRGGGKIPNDDVIDDGAYIDEAPVDVKMNHISIGDSNEDDFVPIEYNNDKR